MDQKSGGNIKTVGKYRITRQIGSGSYARVYLGEHQTTHEKVAVKIIKKKSIIKNFGSLKQVKREIGIHKLLEHSNIIALYDVYETNNAIYIILEYAENGELFGYINKTDSISKPETLKFFQQLVYALEYCADHWISHRDVKPENLLLDREKNIKLSDFGLARVMERSTLLQSQCGSPHYVAPEILVRKRYDGKKCIVWSIGVIAYVMLCGRLPFDDTNHKKLFSKIISGVFPIPSYLSIIEIDILKKMLTVDPEERISLKDIKNHPFFRQNMPPKYIPPAPHVPTFTDPIYLSEKDSKVVDALVMLDSTIYTREYIEEKLSAPGPNIIKTFYHLYLKKTRSSSGTSNRRMRRRGSIYDTGSILSLDVIGETKNTKKVRRNSVLTQPNSAKKSRRKSRAIPPITSDGLRFVVEEARRRSNTDMDSTKSDLTKKKTSKWWYRSLFGNFETSMSSVDKKLEKFSGLLEKLQYKINVITEEDKVIAMSPMDLMSIAERVQVALDLRRMKWEYINPTLFVVHSNQPSGGSKKKEQIMLKFKVKIEPNEEASVEDPTIRYSMWDGTPRKETPKEKPEETQPENRKVGKRKKKSWKNLFRVKKHSEKDNKRQAAEEAMEFETPTNAPDELNINKIIFKWAEGDAEHFINEVVNILKVITLKD